MVWKSTQLLGVLLLVGVGYCCLWMLELLSLAPHLCPGTSILPGGWPTFPTLLCPTHVWSYSFSPWQCKGSRGTGDLWKWECLASQKFSLLPGSSSFIWPLRSLLCVWQYCGLWLLSTPRSSLFLGSAGFGSFSHSPLRYFNFLVSYCLTQIWLGQTM